MRCQATVLMDVLQVVQTKDRDIRSDVDVLGMIDLEDEDVGSNTALYTLASRSLQLHRLAYTTQTLQPTSCNSEW